MKLWLLFEHLPLTSAIASSAFLITGDITHLLIALFFGWLIDVDHLFDYLHFTRKFNRPISTKSFFEGSYFKESGTLVLPLHSFEITGVLFFSIIFSDGPTKEYFLTATTSHLAHLIQDQITHRPKIIGYFLIARAKNRFRTIWFCQTDPSFKK